MQIIRKLKGYYQRINQDQGLVNHVSKISLANLLTDLQSIATHQKQFQITNIHQSFGFNFLPVQTVTHLIKYSSGQSALINEQTIRPLMLTPENKSLQRFSFQFITTELEQNLILNLSFDDPQIPVNISKKHEGIYRIEIKDSDQSIQPIKDKIAEIIQNKPTQILRLALGSKYGEFTLSLQNQYIALIDISDLTKELQEAYRYLKNMPLSQSLTEYTKKIILAYRAKYPEQVNINNAILDLSINNKVKGNQAANNFIVGKKVNRQIIHDLISQAQKFLIICSYRIEDVELTNLVSKKSQEIPVWILTDFSNDMQDRVDDHAIAVRKVDPEYINSDRKKKACLLALRDVGLTFRSGKFHLKSYITENCAYLGSANLTGGSLERNGEAGVIFSGNAEHQFLLDYLRHLWINQTDAETVSSATGLHYESREINDLAIPKSDRLLNHVQYMQDLTISLQKYSSEKIQVYTRNLNPLQNQIKFLNKPSNRIFYGNFNNTRISAKKVPNLHAKVILIGSQVAYIGSEDLAFGYDPFLNLTYRTNNPEEISQLQKQLQALH